MDEEGEVGLRPLDHFLQRAQLVAGADDLGGDADAVTLMTLHNAKGLEYPVVFLTGLEDGLFPLAKAYDDPPLLEEERRLFYVGITRAEKKLYLTHAEERRRNGELIQSRPSSFLDEVPDTMVEKRQTVKVRSTGRAMMRFGGLDEDGMHRIRLTHKPLGPIDLDDWSGVILGGGPYNASDPPEMKSPTQVRAESELLSLISDIVDRDFPFLGCCYGVGMLGSVIGATVDRSYPEPVAAVTVTLTEAGRDEPLFAELPDVFDAFGGHKEAASSLPAHAVCLASSPDCPVQAFRVGTNTYATQFHPELDLAGILTRIDVYKNYGYFAPESAESLKTAARQRHIEYPPTILRRFVERYSRRR